MLKEKSPIFDRYSSMLCTITTMLGSANSIQQQLSVYNQNNLYFEGYMQGLRYAISVIQKVEDEEETNGNP